MHPLLQRQLRKARVDPETAPPVAAWQTFLERVAQTYVERDQERYVLERSLLLSSDEMQKLSANLREERDHLRVILGSITDGVCALDEQGHLLFVNAAGERHLGCSEAELLGTDVLPRFGLSAATYATTLASGQPYTDDSTILRRQDGLTIPMSYTVNPLGSEGSGAVLVFRDMTARQRRERQQLELLEEQSARALAEAAHQAAQAELSERRRVEAALAYQASHDALTGLPNRVLLYERLDEALARARGQGGSVALLLMDLDRFKEINDTMGHQVGDKLLQRVGQRLRDAVRETDTVARLGGDEFAVLLPSTGCEGAVTVAQTVVAALVEDHDLGDETVDIGASIGLACFPDAPNSTTLLRHADVAMYAAKREGGGVQVYAKDQEDNTRARLGIARELREALVRGELVLYYQPKIDFRTGQVSGVEALARWRHPSRGLVAPDVFIPVAEQTGLIVPLTAWVLAEALRQERAWLDAGLDLYVAVNLSARNLQDRGLVGAVAARLVETNVPPHRLQLEITESMLMADPQRARQVLSELRRMGVAIAIDDFGTGYSSLAYLKELPVDVLKIDRSFVKDMCSNHQDAAIVRSTIELAHNLGLNVVAEGVEDGSISSLLERLGCDRAQGFHYSRPLPPAQLEAWLGEYAAGVPPLSSAA
ncbi:MAG: hypothetical protein NVSMB2_10020 [Chloroflexota bacterium]